MECTLGVIIRSMWATGSITRCMVRDNSSGQMAKNTMETSGKTKDMDKADSNGKMVENMRVNGSRANNMEKVSIEILKESKEGASGLMAKEWPGST